MIFNEKCNRMKLPRFLIYLKTAFVFALWLACFHLSAQNQPPKLQYHVVQEGENVYRISRKYGMTEQEFLALNPDAKNVLSVGAKVAVHVYQPGVTANIDTSKFYFHEVVQGETVFGILRKYELSQDLFLANNPEVATNGLKAGMIVRIPKFPKLSPIEEEMAHDERHFQNGNHSKKQNPSEEGYFIHLVEAGETVFSLTRRYSITSNQLVDLNPQLAEGLKEGMRLRIRKIETVDEQPDSLRQPFTLYRIKEGDKLRDILSTFSITQQDVERFNPRVNEGLIPGRMLLIPLYEVSFTTSGADTTHYALDKAYPKSNVIKVALFLPLDAAKERESSDWRTKWVNNNRISLGFFSGLQLALDSLSRMGMNISLHVFSDKERSNELHAILDSMDLVIGPFFYIELSQLVGEMRKRGNNAAVVSPLSKQTEVLAFSNVFKCIPNENEEYHELAKLIPQVYPQARVVIIHENDSVYNKKAQMLSTKLKLAGMDVRVKSDPGSKGGVASLLPSSNEHEIIVVTLGTSKVFINTTLNGLRSTKRTDLQLFIPSANIFSPTLEAQLLGSLKATRAEANFFRTDNPFVNDYITRYQRDYGRLPDKFAHQGFDIGFYFVNKIAGKSIPIEPLHTYLNFTPTGTGAFLNQSFIWIKLDSKLNQHIIYPSQKNKIP
jgi:LysM repeat protein